MVASKHALYLVSFAVSKSSAAGNTRRSEQCAGETMAPAHLRGWQMSGAGKIAHSPRSAELIRLAVPVSLRASPFVADLRKHRIVAALLELKFEFRNAS